MRLEVKAVENRIDQNRIDQKNVCKLRKWWNRIEKKRKTISAKAVA